KLIDRIGTRATLAIVTGVLAVSVLLMSQVRGTTSLFITMIMVRGLGQGALSLVAIALVGKWFKRRVAPAMGAFTILLAFGFAGPIFLVGAVVQDSGWRTAWAGIGYVLLFGLLPLGWLLVRSTPESCGVVPDEPAFNEAVPPSSSLWQALRTPSFWTCTLA